MFAVLFDQNERGKKRLLQSYNSRQPLKGSDSGRQDLPRDK